MAIKIKTFKIIVLIGLATISTACVKQSSGLVSSPKAISAVNFINAFQGGQPADVIIANTKLNASPINYGESTKYINVFSGQDSVIINNTPTQTSIIKTVINFTAYGNFSLFLLNSSNQPDLLLLKDTLNASATIINGGSLRFVNVSPDAQAVDLVIMGGNSLVKNKGYKGYSSFLQLQGNQTYSFEVHKTGTSAVLASLNNIKFQAGVVYTVWLHGLVANTSTADQLTLDIMQNATFQ